MSPHLSPGLLRPVVFALRMVIARTLIAPTLMASALITLPLIALTLIASTLIAPLARSASAAEQCPCKPAPNGACVPDPVCDMLLRMQQLQRQPNPPGESAAPNLGQPNLGQPNPNKPSLNEQGVSETSRREQSLREQHRYSTAVRPPVTDFQAAPSSPTCCGSDGAPPVLPPPPSPPPAQSRVAPPSGGAAPASAQPPSIALTPMPGVAPRQPIIDTGWSQLVEIGRETDGYGLYSYVILTRNSPQAVGFLTRLFTEVDPIQSLPALPAQLNILYVPLRQDKEADFATLQDSARGDPGKMAADYAASLYDYRLARRLLYQICSRPQNEVRDVCSGDLEGGPYLFSYRHPATALADVPPPYLFVDLTDMPERGYGEMLAAFREQVRRTDETDRQRIDTLRNRALQYLLRASIVIDPAEAAVAKIFRMALGVAGAGDKPGK